MSRVLGIDPGTARIGVAVSDADRRVATPKGPGRLWQVFARRVGVVLDATPTKVTFFDDPSRVTTPWTQE